MRFTVPEKLPTLGNEAVQALPQPVVPIQSTAVDKLLKPIHDISNQAKNVTAAIADFTSYSQNVDGMIELARKMATEQNPAIVHSMPVPKNTPFSSQAKRVSR